LQIKATFANFLSKNTIDEAPMKHTGIKKLYYSISEVSKITGLEQYVLRYWETEFPELKPAKNRAGNRIYTNKDIKLIMHIKQLLRDEKYTIEGAKQVMKEFTPEPDSAEQLELISVPQKKKIQDEEIKKEMAEVKEFLEELLIKIED
jgi:DNA-binding transcriptional MerR regulator